ncbi:RNA polymerase sigma-70 factor (ECF subfamily) [Geomicrobium halophilum]|uniref:RNA polymerase sigma-70 factor (ECF subfamily) n=1 Tax=Geomicrobium halophilum TaxID=549000 RepID=A0A841PKK9_9BACL|nr:sigma-70 family RNA polymerase sigma factor [Geomicrobium halophilum]MBB6448214.1 RNA polymerase sigma-70 factor (ECF subfamily) [Geomicrobium halophilum]
MGKPTDKELYERIQMKDKAALELMYDRYEKLLYSLAYRITKDPHFSEEVMQDVFMKLWNGKGAGQYNEDKGKFSSWLLTVTRNTSIDLLRKKKEVEYQWDERDSLQEEIPSVEKEVEDQEKRDELTEAMDTLPDEQQRMIYLFYFQGLSQQNISKVCELPVGTVKGRIRLALKKLRENLATERRVDHGK